MTKKKKQRKEARPPAPPAIDVRALLVEAAAQHNRGDVAGAERQYRAVLAISPDHFDALHLLGASRAQAGKPAEAVELISRALRIRPDVAAAHNNLGYALKALNRDTEAIEHYRRAITLQPDYADAHRNLGAACYAASLHQEALESFRRAAGLKPDSAEAHFGMGNALLALKRTEEALGAYDKALALRRNYPEALNNRGNALLALNRPREAVDAYREAVASKPNFVEANYHAGNALKALKRYDEAAKSYQAALEINPDFRYGLGTMAGCRALICDWRGRAALEQQLVEGVKAGKRVSMPLELFSVTGDPADQLACAVIFSRDRYPKAEPLWRGERYRHERMRVAYLSADFWDHPVAWLIAELIERHDRGKFEILGVALGQERTGPMRDRLKAGFERFVDARAQTDAEVAALLREWEVDIAVDLMGHTHDSRPGIFARRPAPVQVSYLGYPGTTGADFMDYILADRFVIPEAAQRHYVEKVAYLPDSYVAGDTTRQPSRRVPTRAEAGLPEQGFVYCCFHNGYKINPGIFDVWMRILRAVPGSVLWLSVREAAAADNLRREAEARGVAAQRLCFARRVSQEDYLARFAVADLFLDAPLYNAHSTAVDVLWGGVPLLTCPGATFASRVAGSLLHSVGLPELVAPTFEDYEALAVELAKKPGRLRKIRQKLAANRVTSPLFDTDRFRRHVESAYRTMWEIAQRGEPPRSFAVQPVGAIPGAISGKDPGTVTDTRALLAEAVACHNRGDLQGAERACRAVLDRSPDHFDALQLLGAARARAGSAPEAVEILSRAIAINPRVAEAHNNLGAALRTLKRDEEAVDCYRQAVALNPSYLDAHRNLAHTLLELKRPVEAVASLEQALALRPGNAELLCTRGDALVAADRAGDAVEAYRQAIAARPDLVKAYFGLGGALLRLGRTGEAIDGYRALLEVNPGIAGAHYNLGHALISAGKVEEAVDSLRKVLALDPRYVRAYNSLGNALLALNRAGEACAALERAVEMEPASTEGHVNRGNALVALGRREEAIAAYRKALEIRPDLVEAHNNLGNTLRMVGRRSEALASYEKTLALHPEHAYVPGMVAATAGDICEWRGSAERKRRLIEGVRAGKPVSTPFALLGVSGNPADQLACARLYTARRQPPATSPLWRGERYGHQRIRLAYLSADFRDHPVAWLIAQLIEHHDREHFETYGICFGPDSKDPLRKRLKAGFEHFVDVQSKSDAEVAAWLRESEVDIAVDLMGHTADARPGIYARRPVPAQVNYLGFPATMGADYIDYIIADPFVVPEGQQKHYSEKVVYLPDTFQANDTQRRTAKGAPTRAQAGLPGRGFVFCCFNNTYKFTPEFFDIWMRLLGRVEGSVLWLVTSDEIAAANLRREAQARGVARERLVISPRATPEQYLARYRLADLFLDTLPFNAGTTASDALWAGVPVLTCAGEAFASRMAGSVLKAIGLPELVTHTLEDYEALAVRLATRPEELRAIRDKLSANRAQAPLFDTGRFCRHIESAYRTMRETARRGDPPRSFPVEPLP